MSRTTSILTIGVAALVSAMTVSCQPHPDARDDESLRTPPTTITIDHHPPPRMSEP